MPQEMETHLLADDGHLVPNNSRVPLAVYRGQLPVGDAQAIIGHFEANGWSNAWVNGIYPFHHFHATAHEVLGIAAGNARVQFGGPTGPIVEVRAGDAVMIPAGVGHCRVEASVDLTVVGAYPEGRDWDTQRASPEARVSSLPLIAAVPAPERDPVTGETALDA